MWGLFLLAVLAASARAQFAPAPTDFLQTGFNYTAAANWQLCAISPTSAASLTVAQVQARCGGSRLLVGCLSPADTWPVAAATNQSVVFAGGVVPNSLGGPAVTWAYNASMLYAGAAPPASCAVATDGVCFTLSGGVFTPGAYCGALGWVPSSAEVFRVFYTNPCEGRAVNASCPSTLGACGLNATCSAAGTCTSTPKPPVPDTSCVDQYVCDVVTGDTNATTYLAEDAFCTYNNSCVATARCAANHTCLPYTLTTCPQPIGTCLAAGVCNLTTQFCEFSLLPDGSVCGIASQCHNTPRCTAGICGSNVTAATPSTCLVPTTCDDTNGWTYVGAANGTNCTSANMCLADTYCDGSPAGQAACIGTPNSCPQLKCHGPPTCLENSGTCAQTRLASGTPCDDDNACTQGTTCSLVGTCGGGQPALDCVALHGDPPTCMRWGTTAVNATTCVCVLVNATAGSACDDGDLCTDNDICGAGVCAGTPVTCPGDDCNLPTACSPTTRCLNPYPPAPVRECNSTCMLNGVCDTGVCTNGQFNIANPACTPGAASALSDALFDALEYVAAATGLDLAAAAAAAQLAKLPIGLGCGEGPDCHSGAQMPVHSGTQMPVHSGTQMPAPAA